MSKRLSIVSLNSRGVRPTSKLVNKPQHIKKLLEKASISLLQETHIKEQPSLAIQSIFKGQSDIHYSPGTGTSGGLSSIFPENTTKHLHSDQTFVASSFGGFISDCIIINVYFPPHSKWQDFQLLLDYVDTIPLDVNVIIMGDFNLAPSRDNHFHKIDSQLREKLILHTPTTSPTHYADDATKNPSYIDHVFIRLPGFIKVSLVVTPVSFSDHTALTLHLCDSSIPNRKTSKLSRTLISPSLWLSATNPSRSLTTTNLFLMLCNGSLKSSIRPRLLRNHHLYSFFFFNTLPRFTFVPTR